MLGQSMGADGVLCLVTAVSSAIGAGMELETVGCGAGAGVGVGASILGAGSGGVAGWVGVVPPRGLPLTSMKAKGVVFCRYAGLLFRVINSQLLSSALTIAGTFHETVARPASSHWKVTVPSSCVTGLHPAPAKYARLSM